MKISVVIPVGPSHSDVVVNAINSCLDQSRPADEIIVVGSVDLMKQNSNIVLIKNQGSAGSNRQKGSEVASGDIIIYNDADDISHSRRLEIISDLFEKNDILHLNHSYTIEDFVDLDIKNMKRAISSQLYKSYFPKSNYYKCLSRCPSAYGDSVVKWRVHSGATAIRREVLKKVKWKSIKDLRFRRHKAWPRMEDYEFCMETLYIYNKSMIIDTPLYLYSEHSSSSINTDN